MEPETNFYFACCTYRCGAECSYKAVMLLDTVMFISTFLYAVQSAIVNGGGGWIGVIICLVFLYIPYRAIMLFCELPSNKAEGTLQAKTTEYLRVRKIFMYIDLIFLIFFILFTVVLMGIFAAKANGNIPEDAKKVMCVQFGLYLAFFLFFTVFQFVVQWRLGTTLEEATPVITGGASAKSGSLATNQML